MSKVGIEIIAEERQRQIEKEGWSKEHDMYYIHNELSLAAVCYALPEPERDRLSHQFKTGVNGRVWLPNLWPWHHKCWKPTPDDRIRELAKAGALIAAEIDVQLELKKKQCENT